MHCSQVWTHFCTTCIMTIWQNTRCYIDLPQAESCKLQSLGDLLIDNTRAAVSHCDIICGVPVCDIQYYQEDRGEAILRKAFLPAHLILQATPQIWQCDAQHWHQSVTALYQEPYSKPPSESTGHQNCNWMRNHAVLCMRQPRQRKIDGHSVAGT